MSLHIVKLTDPIQFTNVAGGLVPKGAYDNATDYSVGDSVDYNGSSYVMHTDAAAGTLPTNTAYWQVLANKGDTGATGADSTVPGPAGADGIDGLDGKTILNGTVDPTTEGVDGDFYINTVSNEIFGPKAGTWGTGTSIVGPAGATGPQGEKGEQGIPGMNGADAVAGKLPSSYKETTTPTGTTSATLVDVPGMSTTITLDEAVEIAVMASFELKTQSGSSSSTIEVAVNVDGVDHDPVRRYLSGTNDLGIGAIVHRVDETPAGVHTIKLRYRRVSGTATPGINRAHMLVMAMQGAKGDKGDTGDIGPAGADGLITAISDTATINLTETSGTLTADLVNSYAPALGADDNYVTDTEKTKLSRTITGTANQITVTNGNGVSGNPTLSLPQDIHTGASPQFAGLTTTGNINPTTDSARTLGTSTYYWSNTYTDRLYLNSTAYLDGGTAGTVAVTGTLKLVGNFLINGFNTMTIGPGTNIVLDTATGTKIGTATTQKLGFFNATPVVRPASTPANATDLSTALTLVNDLKSKLITLGLIA